MQKLIIYIMIRILSLITIALLAVNANGANPEVYSFMYGDSVRTYTMSVPDSLDESRPLIIYTHGYGSSHRHQRQDLNRGAEIYGFAVCYPDGTTDSNGKKGWNVGYPSQQSMDIDEADFFEALIKEVCQRFGLSRENVFLTGMSNGGDLCYHFMYTRPELFKAYASVAGLTFTWVYLQHRLTSPVPFMEIHGTADKTSMWNGDPCNTGGWGPYLPVEMAVSAIACNNRCTSVTTSSIPVMPESTRRVTRYDYTGSPDGADVTLIEIEGGPHKWNDGDIDTGTVVCEYFSQFLRSID